MFTTYDTNLRSKWQLFLYPSSSNKTHNLTEVNWSFKVSVGLLMKGNIWKKQLQDWTPKPLGTAGICSTATQTEERMYST